MMEGMFQGHSGEEDYIVAMRGTTGRDETKTWRERRSEPLEAGAPTLLNRRRTRTKGLIVMTDDHATRVLASLVPDEIIYNVNDYSNRPYDVCLLFGDVSGFTDLCEMYNKTGQGGPSRLTVVLNNYIGSMVQEILSHNGDVLKFSGDAFLAMWKLETNDSMQDIVHEALDSAIMIQKSYGTYEADGVFLRVKLAISSGYVMFSIIGDEDMSHYVIVGQPIYDVKGAEKKASAGEIVCCHSAWYYINTNEYISDQVRDGYHVKVKGFGPNWRPTQRNVKNQKEGEVSMEMSPQSSMKLNSQEDMEVKSDTMLDNNSDQRPVKNDDYSVRPSVNYAAQHMLRNAFRKFIIAPIMRGIDLDEPLEYLTEMRQIVIVFINVVVTPKIEIPYYISLIDKIFKLVCKLAHNRQGCVNKVSLFDKDLMFVLLFGLRGYKSELESQIALRCAAECYKGISTQDSIITTSIAVTTGITYCGVVGHTLRREYTVISLTVNKAARLMVAYPNKVTCDRETFLHSQLEARNFILQEPKPLKGITNVGPVYEFKEQQYIAQENPVINPYPLLGRSQELKLYQQLVNECVEIHRERGKTNTVQMLNHHNMLLIHGPARIGKSRLLDELILCTPSAIPVHKFTLMKGEGKIPFKALQQIYMKPLGLHRLHSAADREAKLRVRLQKIQVPDFLCALNKVFNVKFEITPLYTSLSNEQKDIAFEKILKYLSYIAFVMLWVVAIDDAEYIDDESWSFLHVLLELDIVFIVMTMGTNTQMSDNVLKVKNHRRVRNFKLHPIDKWYHAGLACQVLDVLAIPPELEKVIQKRSNGNPGWIESFLISLMQAGGLLIDHFNKSTINNRGLVAPPVEMLIRLSPQEIAELETSGSFERLTDTEDLESKQGGWKMYKFSYRDSVPNIMKEKVREKRMQYGNFIPVCVISETCNLDEIDPELSMNVMIIKMFDSLTSYEQLLLKCSAVIGEYFPRDMLMYIMAESMPRSTALAVQKLFDLRVLGCAQGDFSEGDTAMIFTQRLVNPNKDVGIRCDCRGLKIHESCVDLPKYASCGYLRFRISMFQETTYNLLTDNQKKEFHNRAMKYLEKETRRCRSCGNGYFVGILGHRNQDGMSRKVKRKSSDRSIKSRHHSISGSSKESEDASPTSSEYSAFNSSARRKDTFSLISGTSDLNPMRKNVSSEGFLTTCCFGVTVLKKLKDSISLTRTFSYADFSTCQCIHILKTMYTQIIDHCNGSGQTYKMMNAMMEYAYLCILCHNIPQSLNLLRDVDGVIDKQLYAKEEDEQTPPWKFPLLRGRVMTLVGHARLELGQLEEAYLCFQQALKLYGYKFPIKGISLKFATLKYELKQILGMNCIPSACIATVSGYEAEFYDDLSECLSLLCVLFKDVQMWQHAELAAAWSLTKSLASDSNFYGLCIAYSNYLDVCHHLGKWKMCIALEVHALRLCHRKKASIEAEELKSVALLYGSIFAARLMRSEMERSIHIGYIMIRICASVHAMHTSLQVLPLLIHALLIRSRVSEAVTMILELQYCAEEDTDNTGHTWFYTLCLVLQIETGYTMVTFRKCEKFFQVEGDTLMTIRDPDAERRYYTVLWLWCIRNEEWEAATVWYIKMCDFKTVQPNDSLNNVFTALYHFEGLLLSLVGKIDKRNLEAIDTANREIDALITAIHQASKNAKIILPRFYHLQAYYQFINNDESSAFSMLLKARVFASKNENVLEIAWIDHSEMAWTNNLPGIMVDFWKEHCDPENILDYHEIDLNEGKLGLYTLPTPTYY